ncbi:MAG: helix-turn-helix transcriptional regulator [Planctomycetota bacterium]
MSDKEVTRVECQILELADVRYAILREDLLERLCRQADVDWHARAPGPGESTDLGVDQAVLARRLTLRRKRAALTQTELAQRAGIRVETLNRLERGRTTPDFATIRKLVVAMTQAEAELQAELQGICDDTKEASHG